MQPSVRSGSQPDRQAQKSESLLKNLRFCFRFIGIPFCVASWRIGITLVSDSLNSAPISQSRMHPSTRTWRCTCSSGRLTCTCEQLLRCSNRRKRMTPAALPVAYRCIAKTAGASVLRFMTLWRIQQTSIRGWKQIGLWMFLPWVASCTSQLMSWMKSSTKWCHLTKTGVAPANGCSWEWVLLILVATAPPGDGGIGSLVLWFARKALHTMSALPSTKQTLPYSASISGCAVDVRLDGAVCTCGSRIVIAVKVASPFHVWKWAKDERYLCVLGARWQVVIFPIPPRLHC